MGRQLGNCVGARSKECSNIVCILSPDFCKSKWAQIERTSAFAIDPAGVRKRIRPLLLRECRELLEFPSFLAQIHLIDVSTPVLFEANYSKIRDALGGLVGRPVVALDRTKLPPLQPLPAQHRMPYRSLGDQFVGRVDALFAIYDALHRGDTAILQGVGVVAGVGGLGKTQTAIEYVHRFGVRYPGGVYWVDADRGLSRLISQVSDAAEVTIDTNAEEKQQVEQLWKELNKRQPSLLVLDNFPEGIPLRPYLPVAGLVHTLVTTRRQDISGFTNLRLNALLGDAGIALLNSGARQLQRSEAALLVQRLGGLPLALELTKSFLNYRQDASVKQALAEMQKTGEMEVLQRFANAYGDELPSGHETDVARTFQMSWNLASLAAQDLLRVMADLAPVAVPRKLLRQFFELSDSDGLHDMLGESLGEITRLSLVELDTNGDPLMHRLLHAFVSFRVQTDKTPQFAHTVAVVVEAMRTTFDNPGPTELRFLESLVPHAEAIAACDALSPENSVDLLGSLGWHHMIMGRYTLGRNFARAALEKAESSFGPRHPLIASSQSNLAMVLQDLGQLEEARDLLQQALASDERGFEPGHPSIAIRQSNLARVLQDVGQLEHARDLLQQLWRPPSGVSHLAILSSLLISQISLRCCKMWGKWSKRAICSSRP